MDFKVQLNKRIQTFEQHLAKHMEQCGPANDQAFFNEVLSYNMMAGGKRLRPVLLIELCQQFGGDYSEAINFAIAMEMIHTYSLIHDDLPCMDDDALRRGQATTHVKYSEDVAVLAGDALLNSAYELMIASAMDSKQPKKYLKALGIISKSAGKDGMIRGQILDIQNENKDLTLEELNLINGLKTGELLKASMISGAILGGADDKAIQAISKMSRSIGLMFQIKDDLLDVYGDQDLLGKPVGSDEKNHKSTYPSILGLKRTESILREMEQDALSLLSKLPGDKSFLEGLISYIINRKK